MNFSIKPQLLNYVDADGLQAITILVIYQREKVYENTGLKVKNKDFVGGSVVNHPLKNRYNTIIKSLCNDIEKRLLDEIINKTTITKEVLAKIVKGEKIVENNYLLVDYMSDVIQELKTNSKISSGRLRHYNSIAHKVQNFDKSVYVSSIDLTWILLFEKHLLSTGISNATLKGNMSIVKALLARALKRDIISKNPFVKYDMPKVKSVEAVYLTSEELTTFQNIVKAVAEGSMKRSGFYFLLSCYLGYRISDSLVFDPSVNIINGSAVIRAKKNGKTVNMPVLPYMQEVIDYVGANPINLSEQKVRDNVKKIAALAGINKNVKFHSARHTFAMHLLNNGVSREFVADLLGDTIDVSKIYAHVTNDALEREVRSKLANLS
jgi:site-specific recombinase XerD